MVRILLACAIVMTAAPSMAQTEKEISCGYQADLVVAIAQARLNRVAERDLSQKLAQTATWPDKYNVLIPIFAPFIYEQKRRDVRNADWRASTFSQCMQVE